MSTILNNLYADNIEVIIESEAPGIWAVDVKYTGENGPYEDGEYIDGYTNLKTQEDAEFLARAWINGYQAAKGPVL